MMRNGVVLMLCRLLIWKPGSRDKETELGKQERRQDPNPSHLGHPPLDYFSTAAITLSSIIAGAANGDGASCNWSSVPVLPGFSEKRDRYGAGPAHVREGHW